MRIIYVAGPFRGSNAWEIEQNIRRAEAVGLAVAKVGERGQELLRLRIDLEEAREQLRRIGQSHEVVAMVADEADHAECFSPGDHDLTIHRDCSGDGWYRCKECRRYDASGQPS